MRIETSYKVLLGIIVIVAIIGQVKDNIVSKMRLRSVTKKIIHLYTSRKLFQIILSSNFCRS